MHLRIDSIIATTVLTLAVTAVALADTHDRGELPQDRPGLLAIDSSEAFATFERLYPLVLKSDEEDAAKEVRDALTSRRDPWMVVAAAEAVRQGELDKPGSGRVFTASVIELMDRRNKSLHREEFVTVNVLACLGVLSEKDGEDALNIVKAIVDWQKWSRNESARLRDMADRVLLKLTGQDCTLNEQTLNFWEWYIETQGRADPDDETAPERRSRTAPVVFKEPIVGTRTVFVIDVSDSMKWDIVEEDRKKLAKEVPHLDWRRIKTPRDLAAAELVHSLKQLKEEERPKGGRRTSSEHDLSYPHFAIVTYSTEVEMFTDGWESAHAPNIEKWIGKVEDLESYELTNIHGALKMSMGLGSEGHIASDPALDKDALLNGAHTIVFLTDGHPTWSDDSESSSAENQWGQPIGDGEYVKRDKLLELAKRINRFRKVLINTVGIGNHDKDLMRGLAKDSGGTYTDWYCTVDHYD